MGVYMTVRSPVHPSVVLPEPFDLGPIIAEMPGRGSGLLGGKGGSMHLTGVEHGMMGSYAVVGRGAELQQMGAPWRNMS